MASHRPHTLSLPQSSRNTQLKEREADEKRVRSEASKERHCAVDVNSQRASKGSVAGGKEEGKILRDGERVKVNKKGKKESERARVFQLQREFFEVWDCWELILLKSQNKLNLTEFLNLNFR